VALSNDDAIPMTIMPVAPALTIMSATIGVRYEKSREKAPSEAYY
jgi:hypothetical protein